MGSQTSSSRFRPFLGQLFLTVLLVLPLLLAACVPSRMYRPQGIEELPDYSLAFVEFDDQGELWSPGQLEKALELIRAANQRHPDGVVVSVYVHGWNHNASQREEEEAGGNVFGFKRLLSWISTAARAQDSDARRPVVGVYLGWRGKAGRGPLNALTFFNRREAATRIAGIAATEAVYRLVAAAKENQRSRCLLMGHSFGAFVLEQTVSQALVGSLFAPGRDPSQLALPADLVVLLNPASPAIHAKQFVETLERNRLKLYSEGPFGEPVERPLVVSVTASGDWTTRLLFPMGLRVKAAPAHFRDDYGGDYCGSGATQRSFFTRTAGHHKNLHSHLVTSEPLPEERRKSRPEQVPMSTEEISRWEFDPETQQPIIAFEGAEHLFKIKPRRRAFNDTPYWIMQVPPSLIPNHSDIFRFNTFRLVSAILGATGALNPESSTRLVQENGLRPIGLAGNETGGVLFLDRSRRLYSLDRESLRPRFQSCLPSVLDPREGIGFSYDSGYYFTAIRTGLESKEGSQTKVMGARIVEDRVIPDQEIHLPGKEAFSHFAADVSGGKAYFLKEDSAGVWTANLRAQRPVPGPLATVAGDPKLTLIQYQHHGHGLWVADGAGNLWGMDVSQENPTPRKIAADLGWLTGFAYDSERKRLYVAEASRWQVLVFQCRDGGHCEAPKVFVECENMRQPAALRTTPDGRLWIGDAKAQAIIRVSPDGQVEKVFQDLLNDAVSGGHEDLEHPTTR